MPIESPTGIPDDGLDPLAPRNRPATRADDGSFAVEILPSGTRFEVRPHETILDAALAAGVALPYGCKNGACRSCRARVVEGKLHYPDGKPKALNPLDPARGFALLCQAHAESALKLEVEELIGDEPIVVRTLPVKVQEKIVLAHDVLKLTLALPSWARFRFFAGQYIDVVLRDGRRRAFSIANPPGHTDHLELHIRQVDGGSFSAYATEHLPVGAILRVHGPLGSFYLRKDDHRPAILVAGGTGFAPVASIVEDALAGGYSHPLYLYWGVRAERDLYLKDRALGWVAAHANVHFVPVLSEPMALCDPQTPSESEGEVPWPGRTGFVHEAVLEDFPDLSGHTVYLSGPPPMVAAGRKTFIAQGLDPARIHSDSFDYAFETGHDD